MDYETRVHSVARTLPTQTDWDEIQRIAVEEAQFVLSNTSDTGFQPSPSDSELSFVQSMDINCGDIIGGDVSIADKGEQIFQLILEIASGKETKSETLGFGSTEFVPWQIGAVM